MMQTILYYINSLEQVSTTYYFNELHVYYAQTIYKIATITQSHGYVLVSAFPSFSSKLSESDPNLLDKITKILSTGFESVLSEEIESAKPIHWHTPTRPDWLTK